jgi:hypothetical protein
VCRCIRAWRASCSTRGTRIAAACNHRGGPIHRGHEAIDCDLWPAIEQFDRQPFHVRQVAAELRRIAAALLDGPLAGHASEANVRHALFTGYADRLGRRREDAPDRMKLATGHGAALARDSGVRSRRARPRRSATRSRVAHPPGQSRLDQADDSFARASPRFASGRVRAARCLQSTLVITETDISVVRRPRPWSCARPGSRVRTTRNDEAAATAAVARLDIDLPRSSSVRRAACAASTRSIAAHCPDAGEARAPRAGPPSTTPTTRRDRVGETPAPGAPVASPPVVFYLLAPNGRLQTRVTWAALDAPIPGAPGSAASTGPTIRGRPCNPPHLAPAMN